MIPASVNGDVELAGAELSGSACLAALGRGYSWSQCGQLQYITTIERQVIDLLLVDHLPHRCFLRLQLRGQAGHFHGFGGAAYGQCDGAVCRFPDLDGKRVDDRGPGARAFLP